MRKAFKVEIDPTKAQLVLLQKSAGIARFTYNWALDLCNVSYQIKKSGHGEDVERLPTPNAMSLHRTLNAMKKEYFPWMYEVSKWCAQSALQNLERAFKNFWKDCKKPKEQRKFKHPQFKKKHNDSFYLSAPRKLLVTCNQIALPRIGNVRLKERGYIPNGKYDGVSVSRHADKWFVSVWKEVELPHVKTQKGTIGIDLGIKTLAQFSTGEQFQSPKRHKKTNNKIKRLQRRLERQKKGSNKRNKTKDRIAKEYYRITCQRKDTLHKLTSYLVKTKRERTLVIEDLNVEGMKRNRSLARAVSEIGFYEFRRQLEYKCKWHRKELIIADRFFPSSKRCSSCGCLNHELRLRDRIWTCSNCGTVLDRDQNAALNLAQYPQFEGNWRLHCLESPPTLAGVGPVDETGKATVA